MKCLRVVGVNNFTFLLTNKFHISNFNFYLRIIIASLIKQFIYDRKTSKEEDRKNVQRRDGLMSELIREVLSVLY